jgi:electron transfer flavoprotein alpha subunit
MSDNGELMVFVEQREGVINPVAYELLGKGREMADKKRCALTAVLLGNGVEDRARELVFFGAERVYLFDHPLFNDCDLLNYKHNVVRLVREVQPDIFLLGATYWGRSLGSRVAAALGTGLTADCTGLDIDKHGNLVQIRPAFSGNVLAHIKTRTRPQMATVRYKVMPRAARDAGRKGEVIRKTAEILPSWLSFVRNQKSADVNLADAEIIVSGGSGLKKADDYSLLSELADVLGAALGSSRPPVDNGWIGREHQVGFSGTTVNPRVYIACGISGSPQHLAGMRSSENIIAINTDPSAPIFRVADYGIVGDLYEVVPKLIKKIKEYRYEHG